MKQVKSLVRLDGLLTKDQIYTVIHELKGFTTIIDDRGEQCAYSSTRFEPILTPKGSPDFSQMQQIADEVKITCPVVEEAERRKSEPEIPTIMETYRTTTIDMLQVVPDPNLAPDEWHLVFSDYRDLSSGRAQKTAWRGGSNMTSTFVVGKTDALKYKIAELEKENAELKARIATLEDEAKYGDGE